MFSVPTNWDDNLIHSLPSKLITHVYGKLHVDYIGGGRMSVSSPFLSKQHAKKHITLIHSKNLKFNYLLNGACLANREWTRQGNARIRRLLDWLVLVGVDGVTVSLPYIAAILRYSYPTLRIDVSSFAGVDTPERARRWEDLGVDVITLASHKVNRNFELLKRIRESVRCQLQLIANNSCLNHCITQSHHANYSAHSSQEEGARCPSIVDPYKYECLYRQIEMPVEIIRAPWIRPEDVDSYVALGINRIKLVDRQLSTANLLRICEAYVGKHYEGNLMDLFPQPTGRKQWFFSEVAQKLLIGIIRYRDLCALRRLRWVREKTPIVLDNQKLDGFLIFFMSGQCHDTCRNCTYCQEIAERALSVEATFKAQCKNDYQKKPKNYSFLNE